MNVEHSVCNSKFSFSPRPWKGKGAITARAQLVHGLSQSISKTAKPQEHETFKIMNGILEVLNSRGLKFGVVIVGATSAGLLVAKVLLDRQKHSKAKAKWSTLREDVVVLHQPPRPQGCLSLSPFNIKLETFLRVSGIKYVNDFVHYGQRSSGRTPWITVNGEDVCDSQLALEFLGRKLSKDSNGSLNAKEKAVARSVRILMEDHLYWVLMIDSYIDKEAKHMIANNRRPSVLDKISAELTRRKAINCAKEQVVVVI